MSRALPPADATLIRAVLDRVGLDFVTAPGPAFIADAAGRLVWTNQAWNGFVGVDPALPWPLDDLVAAAGSDPAPLLRRGVIAGAAVSSRLWLARSEDDGLLGIAGVIDEPDALAEMSRRLAAERLRVEDVTRLVSDWLWETAPDSELTHVSGGGDAAPVEGPERLLGIRLLEIGAFAPAPGQPANPLDAEAPLPFHNRAFSLIDPVRGERRFILAGLPVFDAATGRLTGFRGTARDVTAETAAVDAAARSRAELGHAIESISEGFALFDGAEKVILFNQKFSEMFPRTILRLPLNFDFAEFSRLAIELGDVCDIPTDLASLSLTERARSQSGLEYALADGRWIRATDRMTGGGSIVCIRTDITELKRRERALFDAKVAAETANRAKSEFLANISHELRTPLNAIIGFSELMLSEAMGPLGNPHYRDYLGDVLSSGTHLLDIINDIIDLAKVEAGRVDLIEDLSTVEDLIDSALRLVRERAYRGGLTVTTEIAPDLPPLRVDTRKFRQILLNLLSNAVKFTPEGGAITVAAGLTPDGELAVSVRDTGIGIAAADIPTAFKPFGQVDGTLSRRYHGAGLGLPLTRAMVEMHDGTIKLDSQPGEGTVATVLLPAARLTGWPD